MTAAGLGLRAHAWLAAGLERRRRPSRSAGVANRISVSRAGVGNDVPAARAARDPTLTPEAHHPGAYGCVHSAAVRVTALNHAAIMAAMSSSGPAAPRRNGSTVTLIGTMKVTR